jgi:signal transduction histidine kinase
MTDSRRTGRPLLLLYILAFYILAQVTWWGYHLVEVSDELARTNARLTGAAISTEEMSKKALMVIGEGSVFLILLCLGFWYIKRSISRELQLARMEKTFLLSVTHELKTPIAAVKLFLETMKSRDLSKEQSKVILSDALRETRRLESLSDNILLAARFDSKQRDPLSEMVDLSEVIFKIITYFPESRIDASAVQPAIEIHGDKALLRAMCYNLIENAIKYSTEEKTVVLKLAHTQKSVALEVADQGIGIPQEERTAVFEKFYRLGNEQTRKTKGTGLGLFIAKNIADMHNGSIEICDNTPAGVVIKVNIPL